MAITSFQDIVTAVQNNEKKTKVAVVQAQDKHALEAVVEATADGLISPILIGDADAIAAILGELGANADDYEIIAAEDEAAALAKAVELVKAGEANAMMKGKLQTGDFMRAVVKDDEMKRGGLISLVGLYETPKYHKLFAVSDMGMNTYPDLEGKKKILLNAVELLHAMGVECPKVACLSAVEKLNPKMPDAVDGDALKQMNASGEIEGCLIEGPISFDLAMVQGAAADKGYESPVAGDADLLLVPDIVSGNLLTKCFTEFADAGTAGIMVGARVPLIVTSRSAKSSDKYNSIALTAFVGQNY